ncbi:hypothetical protein IJ541_01440 [bacterium]|nr:hypothetical protein [bacterium]
MKQKILSLGFLLILSGMSGQVFAQTVEVFTLDKFSTVNPPKSISIKLAETLELSDSLVLNPGVVLNGNLIDVVSPKRLKRDANFSFQPVKYTDLNGNTITLNSNIKASYTKPFDKGNAAKSAVLGVGNHFVKGLSIGVSAVSGAVKNSEGNRLKSSAVSVYKASPASYAEKGKDLYFEPNDVFYLKFPSPAKTED